MQHRTQRALTAAVQDSALATVGCDALWPHGHLRSLMLRVTVSSYAVAELPQPAVRVRNQGRSRGAEGPAFNMALHVAVKLSSVFGRPPPSTFVRVLIFDYRQWTSSGRSHTDALDYLGLEPRTATYIAEGHLGHECIPGQRADREWGPPPTREKPCPPSPQHQSITRSGGMATYRICAESELGCKRLSSVTVVSAPDKMSPDLPGTQMHQ